MSTTAAVKIDLGDTIDRQRYRCPRGHANWSRTNQHFWCYSCSVHSWDVDPEFHELLDKKTGRRIPREAIEFIDA